MSCAERKSSFCSSPTYSNQVDFFVNGNKVNLPMKLGEGGEAFFVFETDGIVPEALITSPVVSPSGSPMESPEFGLNNNGDIPTLQEPDFLDLSRSRSRSSSLERGETFRKAPTSPAFLEGNYDRPMVPHPDKEYAESLPGSIEESSSSSPTLRSSSPSREQVIERIRHLTRKLTDINIPSTISDNGDIILDMTGYKSGDEDVKEYEELVKRLLAEELGTVSELDLESMVGLDPEGNLRIYSREDGYASDDNEAIRRSLRKSPSGETINKEQGSHYVKTLRLTSDQLKSLELNPGANEVSFQVNQGKAVCNAHMYYWTYNSPIVISDIDGTITKSDALGHVLTMLGRDWTHQGVAKLFTDISNNGYNVMYLTARSVGQADSTRSYLRGIEQDGFKVPMGPVILSPDRTIAALRREVIMKKPEVFKMACLRDIQSLFSKRDDSSTPFFAGFGNRITDALSYRSVGVPSSRIFTINSNSEVHMELLELAGYKSSYVHIADLVDHFFPPVLEFTGGHEMFSDVNFWREPIPELSDDESETEVDGAKSPVRAVGARNELPEREGVSTEIEVERDEGEDEDEEIDEDDEDDYDEEEEEEEDVDEENMDGEMHENLDDFEDNDGMARVYPESNGHDETGSFPASFTKTSEMLQSMKVSD